MARTLTNTLFSYVDSLRPIIYINHFDPHILDDLLVKAVGDNVKIEMFDRALGWLTTKSSAQQHDLASFLDAARTGGFDTRMFLVLFDVHESLSRPDVMALLKRIAIDNLNLEGYNVTVFIISSSLIIPHELSWCISVIDVPVPDEAATTEIISEFAAANEINIEDSVAREFVVSFKGLDEFQIRQILNLAYQDGGNITLSDKRLIFQEKKQIIIKSGLFEYIQTKETPEDIGGLDALKNYMNKKAIIFRNLGGATKFGVDIPKGVLISGMPGCGKSLCAKATAALFEMPLIRLDIGRLTGKYAAESEENMITALKLIEIISPCVLWIDEIEKVFSDAGAGSEAYYASYRMFRRFLMWIHEKNNTAYIVATANDISKVPPEFLRKGCFDELFFADLPDDNERRKILYIHLNKRHKLNKEISLPRLAYETEGLSGADLEGLVKEAVEVAFGEGQRKVTTKDLLRARANNKSVSELLKPEIEALDKQRKDLNFKFANERVSMQRQRISEKAAKITEKLNAVSADTNKETEKPSNTRVAEMLHVDDKPVPVMRSTERRSEKSPERSPRENATDNKTSAIKSAAAKSVSDKISAERVLTEQITAPQEENLPTDKTTGTARRIQIGATVSNEVETPDLIPDRMPSADIPLSPEMEQMQEMSRANYDPPEEILPVFEPVTTAKAAKFPNFDNHQRENNNALLEALAKVKDVEISDADIIAALTRLNT